MEEILAHVIFYFLPHILIVLGWAVWLISWVARGTFCILFFILFTPYIFIAAFFRNGRYFENIQTGYKRFFWFWIGSKVEKYKARREKTIQRKIALNKKRDKDF